MRIARECRKGLRASFVPPCIAASVTAALRKGNRHRCGRAQAAARRRGECGVQPRCRGPIAAPEVRCARDSEVIDALIAMAAAAPDDGPGGRSARHLCMTTWRRCRRLGRSRGRRQGGRYPRRRLRPEAQRCQVIAQGVYSNATARLLGFARAG